MSWLSWIASLWSDRLTAATAAEQLFLQLRAAMPDLPWVLKAERPEHPTVELPGRIVITLDELGQGVEARAVELGRPGRDDPPILLRAGYDVTNLRYALSWRARIEPGRVALHALRADAVYEVLQEFADHYGTVFPAGTRLTFVQRQFLPYHGGHTLCFREATIYLQENDRACREFERYFGEAGTAGAPPPTDPS
jgi:hypothetical protein